MDIWTERLERRHLVIVERWVGRTAGALTPNDLPDAAEALADWFSRGAAEPGRLDCLLRVYDTPVGLASLRRSAEADTAELSLLLCEVGYNPLRTATYAAMRMLDRAFSELGFARVRLRLAQASGEIPGAFRRMGFAPVGENDILEVDRETFHSRKYLF